MEIIFSFSYLVCALVWILVLFNLGVTLFELVHRDYMYQPKNMVRDLKNAFLAPSALLLNRLQSRFSFNLSLFASKVILAILILILLGSSYRNSGLDLNINSYTEYPSAQVGRYIQIHDTQRADSKYYKLPAQIKRDDDGVHRVMQAWWPNGGYLFFYDYDSGEYGVPAEIGEISFATDQHESEWEVLLTNEPAVHPQIYTSSPNFLSAVLFFIPALILSLGFFPFHSSEYSYLDDYIQEPLPADSIQSLGVTILYRFSQQAGMAFNDYIVWRFNDFHQRYPHISLIKLPKSYNAACIYILRSEANAVGLSFSEYVNSLNIELDMLQK